MFEDIVVAVLVLVGLTILVLIPNIKILREKEVSIIERLGRFRKIIQGPGIFTIVPIIDRAVETIYIGEKTFKEAFIQDDQTFYVQIHYQIVDPKAFCYITLDAEKDFKKHIIELFESDLRSEMHLELLNEYAFPYGIEITDYVIL